MTKDIDWSEAKDYHTHYIEYHGHQKEVNTLPIN